MIEHRTGPSGRRNPVRQTLSAFPTTTGKQLLHLSWILIILLQDSRAKYGKFVRPSRLIEEKKQTLEEDVQTNSLPAKHQEVVEASGKVFESGEKSRWGKCSRLQQTLCRCNFSKLCLCSACGRSWERAMRGGRNIRRDRLPSLRFETSAKAKDQ